METNSSGVESLVKMRKPYTITKQREKWSEEEHIRFLEALKLYGRAWQRIKEHIGTKTAVQIRSHAQKFFAKLEKEALIKGVPLGQASDIDIPPPRPKRKPCSPYPRKTGVGSLFPSRGATDEKPPMSASSMSTSEQVIDMESNEPQEIPAATETLQRGNKASEDSSCSEVLNLFQDATAALISSTNKTSSNPCTCTEFAPVMKEIKENAALDESSRSVEVKEELKVIAREETSKKTSQQDDQSFSTAATNQVGLHVNTNSLVNPTVSATPEFCTHSEMSSIHPSFPVFQPFTLFHSNQDAYPSFHNISSTLSNLIMTTLLQNPAVHAAASLAATFWPSGDVETPVTEIQERQYNPSPNLATVAASTVAAASAWWATQGLLPLFPPLHPWFAFVPSPTNTIPVTDVSEAPRGDREGVDNPIQNPSREDQQVLNPEQSKRLISSASTSESDEIRRGEILHFSELKASKISNFKPSSDTGSHNPDKARSKKLDRSSCGSNMPSSSEVETDAIVEKHEEAKCEARHVHFNCPPAGESNNRRFRSSGIMNESWKEVSEEGRVAFRALFNRQVLPQTFSPPQTGDGIMKIGIDKEAIALRFDLSKEACTTTHLHDVQGLEKEIVRSGGGIGHGSLTSETGQEKLKARRTGFKPYKRCSVEAKESGSKRMRLEGEAST